MRRLGPNAELGLHAHIHATEHGAGQSFHTIWDSPGRQQEHKLDRLVGNKKLPHQGIRAFICAKMFSLSMLSASRLLTVFQEAFDCLPASSTRRKGEGVKRE